MQVGSSRLQDVLFVIAVGRMCMLHLFMYSVYLFCIYWLSYTDTSLYENSSDFDLCRVNDRFSATMCSDGFSLRHVGV